MVSAAVGTSASFRVGAKGRVVLPAAVRRAAGIDADAEVVARADGQGRMVIETVESIKARVRAHAPTTSGLDATADVRAMRRGDSELSDAAAARRSSPQGSAADSEAAGAALIAALGL